MKAIDNFINNPNNDRPNENYVRVKMEVDNIKNEKEPFEIVQIEKKTKDDLVEEEKARNSAEIEHLNREMVQLNQEIEHLKSQSLNAQREFERVKQENKSQLLNAQREIERIKQENKSHSINVQREINRLTTENKMLLAQNKQLKQSGTENVRPKENAGNIYEVETLLKHRTINKKRSFFVRWKNYSSKHDSWVNESDLQCEKILNDYLKSKGIF